MKFPQTNETSPNLLTRDSRLRVLARLAVSGAKAAQIAPAQPQPDHARGRGSLRPPTAPYLHAGSREFSPAQILVGRLFPRLINLLAQGSELSGFFVCISAADVPSL